MKFNKKKAIGNFSATLTGLVLGGVLGTLLNESVGYSALFFYLFGLYAHTKVATFFSSKVK